MMKPVILDHYRYGLTDHQMRQLTPVLDEMDRNARAYGWEIGRGAPLTKELEMSPDNPFLNPGWKEGVNDDSTGSTSSPTGSDTES